MRPRLFKPQKGPFRAVAVGITRDVETEDVVIPTQALAELFTLLVRKGRRPVKEARSAVLTWHDAFMIVDTSSGVLLDALELAASHQFALWDAIMLAAAATLGCR